MYNTYLQASFLIHVPSYRDDASKLFNKTCINPQATGSIFAFIRHSINVHANVGIIRVRSALVNHEIWMITMDCSWLYRIAPAHSIPFMCIDRVVEILRRVNLSAYFVTSREKSANCSYCSLPLIICPESS